jgi:hypothetical protein
VNRSISSPENPVMPFTKPIVFIKKEGIGTHRPQIPYPLVQARRKHIPNITKHAFMGRYLEPFSDKDDYGLEALVGGELEDALS